MSESRDHARRDHARQAAHRPRVLVLMGGPDAEREVSLNSGAEVAKALEEGGAFEVVPLVIDRIDLEGLRAQRPNLVYPVLHGPWGEGGELQRILEQLEEEDGVPFVGPKSRPAAIAMNKLATKMHAMRLDIRTPRAREVLRRELIDIDPPLVLKPSNDGSSVDLRICRDQQEVMIARAELEAKRPSLMAEEYIEGREMTVGIVNGEVLPIIEIIPATEYYDYEAKYNRDDTRYLVDPELDPEVAEEMRGATRAIFAALGLRDVARADFIVNAQGAWFLEINTAPGMTTHSLVPMAARHTGVEMPEFCTSVARAALTRDDEPNPRKPEPVPVA
ncbi:MAG: D-alanine--D-alanine ligase [Phycisphaera sp.]|nr:D-alanine--D-alanine ligase [Phycisphaera sp.]